MADTMQPRYLRIKNQARHQHYDPTKRHPPWIKLYNDLLGGDDAFGMLSEFEQWQLVRIWLVASRSTRFTKDEDGRLVPVVADEEQTIRRAIQSVKKVPLALFIREGWLIPVEECELVDSASAETPPVASTGASTVLAPEGSVRKQDASAPLSSRGLEVQKKEPLAAAAPPRKRDELWEALLDVCGIDQGSLTRTGRGATNKALMEIRETGATVTEVRGRAAEFRRRYPQISLTPSALAKHWGSLRPAETVREDKYAHLMEDVA